jgi:hypothetical protein
VYVLSSSSVVLCAIYFAAIASEVIQGVPTNPGAFRNKVTYLSEKQISANFVQIWR